MTRPVFLAVTIIGASLLALAGCASGVGQRSGPGADPFLEADAHGQAEPPAAAERLPGGWRLIWSDEFSGPDLDRAKWEVEASCWGGGNDERQCYLDRERNVEVAGGMLRLKARRETVSGPQFPQGWPQGRGERVTRQYSSGKVRTRDLAAWTYGRFSARIKLPQGQGTWPAFWMLPADNAYGGWAASGEIDIMEAVNLGAACSECLGDEGENRSSGALHFGGEWPDNTFLVAHHPLPGGPGAAGRFHVFTVEWGEGRIDWLVDDELFFSVDAADWSTSGADKGRFPNAPFDRPFYLNLNLAVGGKLSETNNEERFEPKSFPAEMLIDWVRVYVCAPDPQRGRACMTDGD